jgi:hypothetical protein
MKLQQLKELNDTMNKEKRYYEGENWYCVNVKRGIDYVGIDGLYKKLKLTKKQTEKLKLFFTEERLNDIYYEWLRWSWVDLNEMFEDKENDVSTMDWADNKKIISLGRSGGWACFQLAQDIDTLIEAIENKDYAYFDNIPEAKKEVLRLMKKVDKVKSYIEKFNNGLNWEQELKYRIEEKLVEVKEEIQSEKEVKTAKKLAEKNGYILAQKI